METYDDIWGHMASPSPATVSCLLKCVIISVTIGDLWGFMQTYDEIEDFCYIIYRQETDNNAEKTN